MTDARAEWSSGTGSRFPTWMWRNEEVHTFVGWLRAHNLAQDDRGQRVGFHGLDLYSMFTSMAAVLAYLDQVDPDAASVARARYGSLTSWQKDPAAYGRDVSDASATEMHLPGEHNVGQVGRRHGAVIGVKADGVVYRPDTELGSHYLQASLPRQFDEFIWFDETRAVDAFGLERRASQELPDTYPFGL